MTPKQKTIFFSATALVSFFAGTLPVHADAVLTFDRETVGSLRPQRPQQTDANGNDVTPPPPTPTADPKQSVTVFLKGTNARVEFRPMGAKPEVAPTTVQFYDGSAQKVYTLNPAAKTYYVQPYKEAIDGEPKRNPDGSGATRIPFSGTVDLKAARANSAFVSKDIAGVSSRQYLVSGNLAMQINFPQGMGNGGPIGRGGFSRGGRGGVVNGSVYSGGANNGVVSGGVYPGGAMGGNVTVQPQGNGSSPVAPGGLDRSGGFAGFTPPSIAVSGEIWSTDGTALFTEGRETPMAAVYRLMLPDDAMPFANSFIKPLITRLKNMKSLPGESRVALQMTMNTRNTDNGQAPAESPLSTHLTIKEIKTNTTLDDTLFAVPADYKEAEPPAPPYGGPGQIRGQGGRYRGNRGQ